MVPDSEGKSALRRHNSQLVFGRWVEFRTKEKQQEAKVNGFGQGMRVWMRV